MALELLFRSSRKIKKEKPHTATLGESQNFLVSFLDEGVGM